MKIASHDKCVMNLAFRHRIAQVPINWTGVLSGQRVSSSKYREGHVHILVEPPHPRAAMP